MAFFGIRSINQQQCWTQGISRFYLVNGYSCKKKGISLQSTEIFWSCFIQLQILYFWNILTFPLKLALSIISEIVRKSFSQRISLVETKISFEFLISISSLSGSSDSIPKSTVAGFPDLTNKRSRFEVFSQSGMKLRYAQKWGIFWNH